MKNRRKGRGITIKLDRVEIDDYGRVIINESDIAKYVKKAKSSGVISIFLANGDYCVETNCGNCPVTPLGQCPLSGCGCE